MKTKASMKHGNDRLVACIDMEVCEVHWYLVDSDKEVQSDGRFDIELYADDTWLAYWETQAPLPRIPKPLREPLYKLFKRIGMREDEEYLF